MSKENKIAKAVNPIQKRNINYSNCTCFRSSYYEYYLCISYKRREERVYSRTMRGGFRICLNKVK